MSCETAAWPWSVSVRPIFPSITTPPNRSIRPVCMWWHATYHLASPVTSTYREGSENPREITQYRPRNLVDQGGSRITDIQHEAPSAMQPWLVQGAPGIQNEPQRRIFPTKPTRESIHWVCIIYLTRLTLPQAPASKHVVPAALVAPMTRPHSENAPTRDTPPNTNTQCWLPWGYQRRCEDRGGRATRYPRPDSGTAYLHGGTAYAHFHPHRIGQWRP